MELIKEAFQEYNKEMELIYEQLTSLKESYSSKEYNLLLEGFWDKVKAIAAAVGGNLGTAAGKTVNTIQKSAEYINDLGKSVYDKGVELGKKAIEISKELYTKVANSINKSVETIKKFPSLVWDNLVALYTTISDELGEIYEKAKEKGSEWLEQAKKTTINIYNKMASKLSETYIAVKSWAQNNKEKFKQSIINKQQEIQEAANTAKQSTFESIKTIGGWMSNNLVKLKQGTIDIGKWLSYFLLGLVVLPFYASYWAIVKLHDTGKELLAAMQSGIVTLKKNLGEAWDILISTMKKNYSIERSKTQPIPSTGIDLVVGKIYIYKGKEVKYTGPSKKFPNKIIVIESGKPPIAIRKEELSEKTNDSYSYIIKRFGDFKY